MNTEMIRATYGSQHTACDVFICHDIDDCGGKWYALKDSVTVRYTMDDLTDGCDVNQVIDVDGFTWSSEIENEADLVEAIEY